MSTIFRKLQNEAMRGVTLSGAILDLGGHDTSPYRELFAGDFTITTANMASDARIRCDFEKPLPIESESFDGVLMINVLEHIFEYRQLIAEAHRILRPKGALVVVVPFMFPYHPSPNDFHRYTSAALERMLALSGFHDICVQALGSGVCATRWGMIERLLPRPISFISLIAVPLARFGDTLLTAFARAARKKYLPSDYALGFLVTAAKA